MFPDHHVPFKFTVVKNSLNLAIEGHFPGSGIGSGMMQFSTHSLMKPLMTELYSFRLDDIVLNMF